MTEESKNGISSPMGFGDKVIISLQKGEPEDVDTKGNNKEEDEQQS